MRSIKELNSGRVGCGLQETSVDSMPYSADTGKVVGRPEGNDVG